MIKRFKLGCAPGGQILFRHLIKTGFSEDDIFASGLVRRKKRKISDFFWGGGVILYPHFINSRVVAFTMKDPDEHRDLRWKLGRNDHFFNQDVLIDSDMVIVVEGENDLFGLYMEGHKNVVALCGTHFNEKHLRILKKYQLKEIVLKLDDDEAGKKAEEKISSMLKKTGIKILMPP